MEEQYQGLVLNFYKQALHPSANAKLNGFKGTYYMFGYYDSLDIIHTKKWIQYSPRGIENLEQTNPVGESNDKIYDGDIYSVKLLVPPKKNMQSIKAKCGANYSMLCANKQTTSPPLLSIMLFNFSKTFIGKESQEDILESFATVLEKAGINLTQTESAIFQSIGYYDIVLLMYTDKWLDAHLIQEKIRTLRVDDFSRTNDVNDYVVSNCHLLHGAELSKRWSDIKKLTSEQEFTVRFNLLPGKKLNVFSKSINDAVKQQLLKEGLYTKDADHEELSIIKTHGRSDCIVLGKLKTNEFLSLFLNTDSGSPAPFCPGSDFYKNNIINLRTSIRFVYNMDQNVEISNNNLPDANEEGRSQETYNNQKEGIRSNHNDFIDQMNFTLNYLDNLVDRQKIHMREARALRRTLQIAQNFIEAPYSFDVWKIVSPVIQSLLRNLLVWINYIENLDSNDAATKTENIKDMFEMIGSFRQLVGQFLVDLMHSDRFFMEGITLIHPSVGSATKLLLSYNAMIIQLGTILNTSTNTKYKYSFLVTSGGCDITTATNLTQNISPAYEMNSQFNADNIHFVSGKDKFKETWIDRNCLEDRIIVLQLSERSIFDVSGTMFRILHELMHYCGNRDRKSRAENIRKSFAYLIANYFANILLVPCDRAEIENSFFITEETKKSLLGYVDEIRKKYTLQFADKLAKSFESDLGKIQISSDGEDSCEFDYYSYPLIDNMISQYEAYFHPNIDQFSDCSKTIYNIQLEYIISCYEEIIKKFNENNFVSATSFSYLTSIQLKSYADKCTSTPIHRLLLDDPFHTHFDYVLYKKIYWAQSIAINPHLEVSLIDKDEQDDIEKIKKFFKGNGIADMIWYLYRGYAESFCDCMACRILNISLPDYLLSFLYEKWDIMQAFPNNSLGHLLRIGSVLRVYFCDDLTENKTALNNAANENITSRCNYWKDNGWLPAGTLNSNELIAHTNEALESYESIFGKPQNSPVFNPLEAYLNARISSFENMLSQNPKDQHIISKIQETYRKNLDVSSSLKVYEASQSLLSYWSSLGG